MLTDFAHDHVFTIAWFGVMAFVWFGWGQEAPPSHWRWRLGVGSGMGIAIAGVFGYAVALRWNDGTALEGQYEWFGVLVLVQVVLAGAGCFALWKKQQSRWMAWWVAFVVALHFIPLAFLLSDESLIALGVVQAVGLIAIVRRLRYGSEPTSRLVGPFMGLTLVLFAVVSIAVWLGTVGSPW